MDSITTLKSKVKAQEEAQQELQAKAVATLLILKR